MLATTHMGRIVMVVEATEPPRRSRQAGFGHHRFLRGEADVAEQRRSRPADLSYGCEWTGYGYGYGQGAEGGA